MSDKWTCKFGPTWNSSEKSIDSNSDIGWIEVHDSDGNTVAMVTDEGGGITIQSADREMERRAHLIAAAPELYEALEIALKSIESLPEDALGIVHDTPERQGWFIRDEVAHNLGRALTKARGEGQ